jgi:hypothetical protein
MQHTLQMSILSDEQLRQRAPAAFAVSPHISRSDRYRFVPTIEVIKALRFEGFYPVSAQQSNCRDDARVDFTKHMIRFRRDDEPVDSLVPEVVLVNSHDGTSGYQLIGGLFRFICCNGLMLSNRFESVSVLHRKDQVRNVIEGSYRVIQEARKGLAQAREMSQLLLTYDEQRLLAASVHAERFGHSEIGKLIQAEELLKAKRKDDLRNDLWTTTNRLQEYALGGGVRAWDRSKRSRRVSMRAVNGIDQTIHLNRTIWGFADQLMELKAA